MNYRQVRGRPEIEIIRVHLRDRGITLRAKNVLPELPLSAKQMDMETRIQSLLEKMGGLKQCRKTFLVHVLVLFVSLRGRLTFLNMARYGSYSEKTYRRHFEEPLDWVTLNTQLIDESGSGRYVTAGDASFYPKSGKHTPHLGNFWNGCAGKAMHGLEGHTLAVIDLDLHTAFHLHTQQTPGEVSKDETRTQHYVQHIIDHKTVLRHFSKYLVYDGAAAKKPFVDRLGDETDLELVSKMRCDADLRYLYTGPHPKRRGPRRKYAGKMNCAQPDLSRFDRCHEDEDVLVYTAVVNSRSLQRDIRIAYVLNKARDRYVILFSTDVSMSGRLIYEYYRARFQLEFLFRDAKQYTGLTHCQARSEQKIAFHINASLTSVSLCRADFYADAHNHGTPFSIRDYQTVFFNTLFLEKLVSTLDLDPTREDIATAYEELVNFGRIAA